MKKRRTNSGISSLRQAATVSDGGDCKKMGEIERKVVVLVKYEALPEYMKDNEYIRNYYRCEWPLKDVVFSVFSFHNETFNIWTHLVGFFIFMWLMIMSLLTANMSIENVMATFFRGTSDGWLTSVMTNQTNGSVSFSTDSSIEHLTKSPILDTTKDSDHSLPIWPWLVFLTGAISSLIFSSISHLFACHSRRFHYFFWRLDYAGISVMIVCSFFAPIYYTFSDHPIYRFLYLSSISLFGILVVLTLLSPALASGRFRSFRATLFLCMGFSGLIPATHAAILNWDQPQVLASLVYEIVMGLLYGIGAFFYVTRIPERWKPGAFDIVGHSHQIFHVFVVAAALAHSYAILVMMEWRRGLPA